MALIQTENLLGGVERRNSERRVALRHPSTIGTGLMGTQLDGYLALQENIHLRTCVASMPQAPHEAHRGRVRAVYIDPPRSFGLCEVS